MTKQSIHTECHGNATLGGAETLAEGPLPPAWLPCCPRHPGGPAPLPSTLPGGPGSPALHRAPGGSGSPAIHHSQGARLPCSPRRCPPEGEAPLGSQSRCQGAFPALGSAVHPAPSLPCSQDSCSSATSHACFPSPDGATAWVPPQHIHSWGATPGLPAKEAIREYLPTEGCPMMLLCAGNE